MHVNTESRTSASLLARLRLAPADQTAWAEFVNRYGRKIYGWCRHWGLQEADAQDWLEHQRENRATGQAVQWAVVDAADDERVLAAMNCFGIVPEVECEVGYWAHPDARGRGVVTRAMREVVRYAFEDLGVRRVTAGAATENTASRHVIEANGLTAWGTERLGTTVRAGRADIVWYDVLVEEWRRSRRF